MAKLVELHASYFESTYCLVPYVHAVKADKLYLVDSANEPPEGTEAIVTGFSFKDGIRCKVDTPWSFVCDFNMYTFAARNLFLTNVQGSSLNCNLYKNDLPN